MAKLFEKKKPELSAEEKRQAKAEKERIRSQLAFTAILSTMYDIAREEVSRSAIDGWRRFLNAGRVRGQTIKTADFLALTEGTDPFNAAAPAHRALAEWFAEKWRAFQPNASSVHVRGLHYILSRDAETPDAIRLPNGMIYDNTDNRWKDLERAGKYARYLGLIPANKFQDRRSREPVEKLFSSGGRSLSVYDPGSYAFEYFSLLDLPEFPDFPALPAFPRLPSYTLGFHAQQRYRLEVWIEKSTQEEVIQQVCDRHQVSSVTAQGEISISAMWRAIDRAAQYNSNTTTIILYISDFDPAGKSMPVAAARKLEFLRMMRRMPVKMRLYPIVLTYDQCVQYQLPRTPIKETDDRRHSFEYRYGSGATELDALESLYPGELAKLLDQSILRFRDTTVYERVRTKRNEIEQELKSILKDVHAQHGMDDLQEEYREAEEALEAIEGTHDEFADRYSDLVREYEDDVSWRFRRWSETYLAPLSEKVTRVMRAAGVDLEERMPDIDAYEMPEAEEVLLDDDCLYDSAREYIPQLAAYKKFAGKFLHLIPDEEEEEESS